MSPWEPRPSLEPLFFLRDANPNPLKVWLTAEKLQATPWHSSSMDVVLNVSTQLLAGCLSNTDGSWPFSSSLQTTWPLRCFWLCIIHWWCPSHESLRWCIQTLTRLTDRQQTRRVAEQAGWMEMSTWEHALTGGRVLWSHVARRVAKPPHLHIYLSCLHGADSWRLTECKTSSEWDAHFGPSHYLGDGIYWVLCWRKIHLT